LILFSNFFQFFSEFSNYLRYLLRSFEVFAESGVSPSIQLRHDMQTSQDLHVEATWIFGGAKLCEKVAKPGEKCLLLP
jgi:hypothetical protein